MLKIALVVPTFLRVTCAARGRGSPADDQESVRINKCLRHFASRRESDRLIEDGRVKVNGQFAELGQRVSPGDVVTFDGREVNWERRNIAKTPPPYKPKKHGNDPDGVLLPGERDFSYIKYNKPQGITCTTDRSVRGNVVSQIRLEYRVRASAPAVFV